MIEAQKKLDKILKLLKTDDKSAQFFSIVNCRFDVP
jgi:hypothetical protein